jgi:hypothetical protein
MKYVFCALPMLLCVEAVSLACLILIILCFMTDIMKAAERR